MTPDELVAFAEDLSRIAASGGGPKALAERLAKLGRIGVLVEDAESRHLAAAGLAVAGNAQPALTLAVSAGDARLGRLCIFGEDGAGELAYPARLTAGAIGVELAREAGGQPGRRRAYWERLAGGAYADAATARDDAAANGIAPATHYVAVALEPEASEERTAASDRSALRAAAAQALRSTEADGGVLERAGMLLFFVPAAREVDVANARTAATLLPKTLAKKHPQLRVGGGVGTRVPLLDLRKSVEEAQHALAIARRMFGNGRVGVYEDLGAYPMLLGGADSAAMRAFAARTLAPLRAYDEKHQTELERTLRLYFNVGENVKTAASELNVHRHTVFYRLRQIGEISGCKLDDPHDQLTLRMAMAIDALTS